MIKCLAAGLLVLGLSGCSAAVAPSPSATVSATVPVDAVASFKKIAADSCDKAFAEGVVETRDDYGLLVMIPKEQAIDGYSAVYKDLGTGRLDLIYEADSFYACAAALMWAMADEGGDPLDSVEVTFVDGKYLLSEAFEDTTFKYEYTVVDGLIASGTVTSTDEPEPTLFTERYGNVGAENVALIQQAVNDLVAAE